MRRRKSISTSLSGALRKLRDSPTAVAVRRRLYDRAFARTQEFKNLNRGLYRSFDEARRNAPPTMPAAYVLDDDAYARRDTMESHDYAALLWLGPALERGCSLLDFGGHVGVHYYIYRRYLDYADDTRWIVCEQPQVAALGRTLAGTRGARHLSFVEDLADVDGADVFHSAGCIQFVEEPLHQLLVRVPRRPRAVLINKLPLHDRETRVTVQNTGRSFSPCYLFNADELIASVERLGYQLVDRWACPDRSTHIPFHPDYTIEAYAGLYFESTGDPTN